MFGKFWDLGLSATNEQIGQTGGIFFGTGFVVEYGHAKHEI
jgi:hypothetical protein